LETSNNVYTFLVAGVNKDKIDINQYKKKLFDELNPVALMVAEIDNLVDIEHNIYEELPEHIFNIPYEYIEIFTNLYNRDYHNRYINPNYCEKYIDNINEPLYSIDIRKSNKNVFSNKTIMIRGVGIYSDKNEFLAKLYNSFEFAKISFNVSFIKYNDLINFNNNIANDNKKWDDLFKKLKEEDSDDSSIITYEPPARPIHYNTNYTNYANYPFYSNYAMAPRVNTIYNDPNLTPYVQTPYPPYFRYR